MSKSVLDMSVSLDGFVADQNDYLGGEDGERLHKWADAKDDVGERPRAVSDFEREWTAAGAVVSQADGPRS